MKTYTSESFDTTIIEIKEELDDLKNVIEYLELDDINFKYIKENNKDFSNNHLNNLYKDESLYILNYLGGKEIVISYGFIRKIEESKIYHKCSTDKGSSGSPILSLENNRLIGIHYGGSNNFNFNLGTLIAFPIMEFQIINTNNYSIKKTLNSMTIIYKIDNDNRIYNKLRLFEKNLLKIIKIIVV
jgi:V8-like Glu-specific endopeptidase